MIHVLTLAICRLFVCVFSIYLTFFLTCFLLYIFPYAFFTYLLSYSFTS